MALVLVLFVRNGSSASLQPEPSVIFLNTDNVLPLYFSSHEPTETESPASNNAKADEQQQQHQKSTVTGRSCRALAANQIPERDEGTLCNPLEARIVALLLLSLKERGIRSMEQVGVITPYRAQVRCIEEHLAAVTPLMTEIKHRDVSSERGVTVVGISSQDSIGASLVHSPEDERGKANSEEGTSVVNDSIDISTVDKFQGRDKDVVILSISRDINIAQKAAYVRKRIQKEGGI